MKLIMQIIRERKRMGERHLYRAKRKDNGEWVAGCLLIDYITGQYFIHACGNSVNESDKIGEEGCLRFVAFEVDPATLCQCTGYKGIWENDIFQFDGERYMIVFSDASLTWNAESIFSPESIELGEFCPSEIEVIGNIFDNTELLVSEDCT